MCLIAICKFIAIRIKGIELKTIQKLFFEKLLQRAPIHANQIKASIRQSELRPSKNSAIWLAEFDVMVGIHTNFIGMSSTQ